MYNIKNVRAKCLMNNFNNNFANINVFYYNSLK